MIFQFFYQNIPKICQNFYSVHLPTLKVRLMTKIFLTFLSFSIRCFDECVFATGRCHFGPARISAEQLSWRDMHHLSVARSFLRLCSSFSLIFGWGVPDFMSVWRSRSKSVAWWIFYMFCWSQFIFLFAVFCCTTI